MDELHQTASNSSGRFLPATLLDFSRYAKNLAWLLDIKTQAAQELLSRMYGYEHLHELQQAIKAGGSPGPYWDQGSDELHGWEPAGLCVFGTVPGERSRRHADVFLKWKRASGRSREYLEGNERLIVELGLTDSPESHRGCVRRVKAFLEGKLSVDERGFPCGIWAFLFDYSLEEVPAVQGQPWETLVLPEGQRRMWSNQGPLLPREQLLLAVKDRSVRAFKMLCKGLERVDLDWSFGFEDDPCHWESLWDVINYPDMIADYEWHGQCAAYAFKLDGLIDEDEQQARSEFIRWPCARRFKACRTEMPIAEVMERVSQWRMSWMLDAAEAWSRRRSGVMLLNGMIYDEARGGWTNDFGSMDVLLESRELYDNGSMEHYSVVGTMSAAGSSYENRTVIGCVQGSYVVPCTEKHYVNDDDLKMFLDDHEFIAAGWKVAERYMSIRGVEGMGAWTNAEGGCGLLIVRLAMSAEFDTDEWRGRAIATLANSFNEEGWRYTSSTDSYWKDDVLGGDDYEEDEDLVIQTPGIVIVSVPGVESLGIAFHDEDDGAKQIIVTRKETNRSEARLIQARRMANIRLEGDEKRVSRSKAILQAAGDTVLDLAVFDADGEWDS